MPATTFSPNRFARGMTVVFACGLLFAALASGIGWAGDEAAPSWKSVGWGGGGYFWTCAFHPAKDGVIYLGGDVNGVYKTDDSGKQWRICNNGISDHAIYSMIADPKNVDTLYVGTPSGTCKSTDAGAHWTFLEQSGKKALNIFADRGKSVRGLAVDSQGNVYAGTPAGKIFKSTDGGQTWTKLHELTGKGGVYSVTVSPCNPKLLLASTGNAGLLKSEDAGATWAELPTPIDVRHALVASADDQTLYAACDKKGIWKSVDGGKTWVASTAGISEKCAVIEIVVDPANSENVFCIGNEGWNGSFYRSTDAAKTWTCVRTMKRDLEGDPTLPQEFGGENQSFSSLTNIATNPRNPKELFLSANWRLIYSADGGLTWEERSRGADITCVHDIRFLGRSTYVTAMDEGLLATDDDGTTWRQLCPMKWANNLSGHQWRVQVTQKADGTPRIVSTCSPWGEQTNKVLISEDGGKNFQMVTEGIPNPRPHVNCMWGEGYARALATDPKDPNVMYLGIDGDPDPAKKHSGGGVFKSTDGGKTWKALANQPGSRRMFYALAVDPTDSKRIYWGACGNGGGLYRSDDAGESWTQVFKNETWIFNVHVSPTGVVYCPGTNLWRSKDHGATWEKLTDFRDATIVGLDVHPTDEKTIWLSRVTWSSEIGGGIHKTSDGGATWQDFTGDIPYRKPMILRYNPETGLLWAGGVGLYTIKQRHDQGSVARLPGL